ncbi:hypothetical protein PLESTB_000380200 [Pleodorina starrii]|uniref:DEK-C domain-containing protein n=1 Tax=Pleodorina starrii TaxID=330485 RepID=A0A9W6EZT8_9CHLO|nr:hypothetical protein PLESTM_000014900 [Pleodorina starrii]GLC50446.1 hypothetical protein PLESTB_000380200 [Pleodorina starrii]GLC73317.1 hypothetical protein PLESTF_001359800 [Pleodorina starrii]
MASEEDEQITQVVMDFLKTADMNVVTERMVLTHVQNTLQLSKPASEYKGLVSSTIDKFLESLGDAEAAASGDDDGGAEDQPESGAGGKRGRKRAGGDAGAASKRSRGTDEVLFSRDLSSRRKARVRRWEGKLHVDVREFYQAADAGEAPTQKGLSMDPGQWARLARDLPALLGAQREGNAGAPASQLSKTRIAAVSEFKGTYYLGLREYYEKDGQLLPTKKGVNLNLSEAEALLAASAEITAAAGLTPGDLPPPDEQEAQPVAAPAAAPPRPPQAAPAAAAAAAAAGGGDGAGGEAAAQEVVELGSHKRLSISRFQGRLSVDLREFYEKNGQVLPGKKGIALSPADWEKFSGHMGEVNDAFSRRDMNYCLQLSGMRRVSLSEFKGVTYVGVREFYDKGGGELAPGQKGLSLTAQQWAACMAGAPGITAALHRAQAGR